MVAFGGKIRRVADLSDYTTVILVSGSHPHANTGLTVLDTDASHKLTIKPASNLSADRTLNIATGDADRTLTLTADASIGGTSSGTNTGDQTAAGLGLGTSSDVQFNSVKASKGSPGVSANGVADLGVFQDDASNGISILTPDNTYRYILFGGPTSNAGAQIISGGSTVATANDQNMLAFCTAAAEWGRANGVGSFILGGTTIDAAAKLQIDSTTKGLLPPRMTTTQRNAISSPPAGLEVYDSTLNKPCFYNGTLWSAGPKLTLTAATTYYVRTGGSDSNDGSANDDSHAFATINGAVTYLNRNVDANGYAITISVADGTYTTSNNLLPIVGCSAVAITGNTGTPANVLISTTSANCFAANDCFSTVYTISGVEMRTTTSGSCIVATQSRVVFTTVRFGTCAASHVLMNGLAKITASGNYTISGGAARHWHGSAIGLIVVTGVTITISGTPAFSNFFADCSNMSFFYVQGNTYSGSATGTRYSVTENSVLSSGATLPGNVAGSTATGGQYL